MWSLFRRMASSSFPDLLSHLGSSTIFLLLILLVLFAGRRWLTASARFALALTGIMKFVIPTSVVMPLVRFFRNVSPAGADDALGVPFQLLGAAFRLDAVSPPPGNWPTLAMALWLFVAFALVIRFALIRHRLVSLSMRTASPPRPREVEALNRARRRVGVRRSIDLARSPLPEAPAVLRILRPLVVLPPLGCDDLSEDELESLLCHECAHVARHDNLISRVESLICALFWFHPLIWIAQRITGIERERACDEVVAATADERETYLAALTKFCQAAIAPRLPGVSCMATSKLKERMDHIMDYASLKDHAPSLKRVIVLATAFLVLFTVAAGFVGGGSAFAVSRTTKLEKQPYSIKLTATRSGGSITLHAAVRANQNQQVVAASTFVLDDSRRGSAKTSLGELAIVFEARPDRGDLIAVDVEIDKSGTLVQRATLLVSPTDLAPAADSAKFTGEPLSLNLKDADLRDVVSTFGKITGMDIRMDQDVQGTVSVNWQNVPWDEAFDSMLKDNGLTYRIEGKVIYVTRR
jgi:beta-lactamase regulating signal transducer with metallopeptidase domain